MKTFLENLKKELKKRQFSKEDIEEILEDHKEMIEEAKNEGLSDDELEAKFGDPEKLAADLLGSKSSTSHEDVDTDGYTFLQSFVVLDSSFDVNISLVDEDLEYVYHDQETIEVYYKDIKNVKDYTTTYSEKVFVLQRNKGINLLGSFRTKSARFIVKVPKDITNNLFHIKMVSGDILMHGLDAKEFEYKTTSGDGVLNQIKVQSAKISTVSGDLRLFDGEISSVNVSVVSGDANFHHVQVNDEFDINSVSGDIHVADSEAKAMYFKTVSGDFKGKEFYPETLKFKSVSGDVTIQNSDDSRPIKVLSKKALSGSVRIS